MRKLVIAVMAVVLQGIFVSALTSGCDTSKPKHEAWNEYRGELFIYRVRIDESRQGGVWSRFVHLETIEGFEMLTANPFGIVGHDYDGDGQFDRIFIQKFEDSGSDGVYFTGNGKRIWEPCSADKDKIRPFTDTEVALAQAQLYLAMATVLNQGHLVESFKAKLK